jgi:hypothetical protein
VKTITQNAQCVPRNSWTGTNQRLADDRCELLGFRSGVDGVYVILRREAASLGNWFPKFRGLLVW